MIQQPSPSWTSDFGLNDRLAPAFFANKDSLTPSMSHAHVLRRAFDLLALDGILCVDNTPLIYFRLVKDLSLDTILPIQRQFWNHGGAPILVLVSNERIHIYSAMSRPVPAHEIRDKPPSLVAELDRIADGLRSFIVSVESGEFFRQHARSFDPNQRIDRDLLSNLKETRDVLDEITNRNIQPEVLDALLCRVVFTCYLFDREVIGQKYLSSIGIENASHLRDVLSLQPLRNAKSTLYEIFSNLQNDFNGDLFSDDLEAEARKITHQHVSTLKDFFEGTHVRSGQKAFWPYDFSAIPIETISAIYEHFLKAADETGAFYTPRFLAEIVLDTALHGGDGLIGKTYLDPACGSGIFLVGLFNRMAEEWKHANPNARNDRRARELMQLLTERLFGVDINPTACRIAAFSLYLAYLDQLSPRDIQELQAKGRALPHLVAPLSPKRAPNIQCADFFSPTLKLPAVPSVIVGNPPWGSIATADTPAGRWCVENKKPLPDKQIASAFIWKAATTTPEGGYICFVLPHGTLFNHGNKAVEFQKAWLTQCTVESVLNLADFRWFLFEKAVHPAIVVRYRPQNLTNQRSKIEYLAPKVDWAATQAEIISVAPVDRSWIVLSEVVKDLDGPDAPQTWKQRFWATPRDLRFLDRLSLYPRLRDRVRSPREVGDKKPWVMAEGFQPLGPNDDPEKAKVIQLPSKLFIEATSPGIDLFLLPEDCRTLRSANITVRGRSNKSTEVYNAPHVLITKGFQRIAFCDFPVGFRHALRGIRGPEKHRNLLMFLAAYLRSGLAKYFMFHTSSSWGMYRPEGHVEEVLRLPMPFPEDLPEPSKHNEIVEEVARIITKHAKRASENFIQRSNAIAEASSLIEPLIQDYFDVQPTERILLSDTLDVVIPSIQPTQSRMPVPTVEHSTSQQRDLYTHCLCETLNGWARRTEYVVAGSTSASDGLGIGLAVLRKVPRSEGVSAAPPNDLDLLQTFDRLRKAANPLDGAITAARGVMIFDENSLYLLKSINHRYWTQTTALNDADEIAGSILMHSQRATA
ncbi:HsdM family class I SAM-dependent methyltransferase [Bradyrhizobium sp. USDA 10063]